jgi:hypothetical protein
MSRDIGNTYRLYYFASEGSTEEKAYVYAYDRDHAEDYAYDKLEAHRVADVTATFPATITEWGVVENWDGALVRRPIHNAVKSEVSL